MIPALATGTSPFSVISVRIFVLIWISVFSEQYKYFLWYLMPIIRNIHVWRGLFPTCRPPNVFWKINANLSRFLREVVLPIAFQVYMHISNSCPPCHGEIFFIILKRKTIQFQNGRSWMIWTQNWMNSIRSPQPQKSLSQMSFHKSV